MRKKKAIYIFPSRASFVVKDIGILSENYEVLTPSHVWNNGNELLVLIKQFFFLCRHFFASEFVLVMFGGLWSFLPALFGKLSGKPVFIILGGADCVSLPSIDYGSLRKPHLRFVIKYSLKWARELLPVSATLVETDHTYCSDCGAGKQGYKAFFPKIKTPNTVISNGFETQFWNTENVPKKQNTFITVAEVHDMRRYRVKGIYKILEIAPLLPECNFIIGGITAHMQQQIAQKPANVTFLPFLAKDDMVKLLSESQFYLQLSVSEGFPNAVCEGMLCRCIPVVSSVGAMPFIAGDTGLVISSSDTNVVVDSIKKLLQKSAAEKQGLAEAARQRVISEFSLQVRADALNAVIRRHCEKK